MDNLNVAFYPELDSMLENPYWRILREGLSAAGVHEVTPAGFGRRWLSANRGKVGVLHFHYIQDFYAFEHTRARLRWIVRFASNLLLAHLWGYRTVFTVHNLNPTQALQPLWVDRLGHQAAISLCDALIVHSPLAKEAIRKQYKRGKNIFLVDHPNYVTIYPNQVNRSAARQALNVPEHTRCFLFFGGIRPNKGVLELVRAFRLLSNPDLRLLIAGKPWPPFEYADEVAALARQDPRIQMFPRYIPEDEIQVYMQCADLVILPFTDILTSGSTMLAMSFAKAVLVPAMGGLPDLVQDGAGLLYQPGEQGLLQGLTAAATQDLQEIGKRAYTKVQGYTPRHFAEQTLAVYTANQAAL
jgi:beta-1,4-mannosyltransferase